MLRPLALALNGRAAAGGDDTMPCLLLGTSEVLALRPSDMTGRLVDVPRLFDLMSESVCDRGPTLSSGCVGPDGNVELLSLLLLVGFRRLRASLTSRWVEREDIGGLLCSSD